MRSKLIALCVSTLATIAACVAADGQTVCTGGYCPRPPGPVVYYRPAPAPLAYVPVYQAPAPQPAYRPAPAQVGVADEAAAFLSALNQWRSWHGRPPLAWDSALAWYASTNGWAGHQPGSTGGAAQCWSSTHSLLTSLELWKRSPAHAAILLGATVSVGAAPCPSGATCNAR